MLRDPGLDLHRHRHARGQADGAVIDLHDGAIERYARAVVQLLPLRLAAVVGSCRPRRLPRSCCRSRMMASCDTLTTSPCRRP